MGWDSCPLQVTLYGKGDGMVTPVMAFPYKIPQQQILLLALKKQATMTSTAARKGILPRTT